MNCSCRVPGGWWSIVLTLLLAMAGADASASDPAAQGPWDSWIAGLEGGWAGEDNLSALGRMPFAVLFEWQEDGSLYSHSALNAETFIDLRFRQDQQGRWLLEQRSAMEGFGEQAHVLTPLPPRAERRRWVWAESPEYLSVEMAYDDAELAIDVTLRGEPHARFRLQRVPPDQLPEMKREMMAQAAQTPQEGTSIHDVLQDGDVPWSILEGRDEVAAHPEDAGARLRLARALVEAIQADGSQGPRYAYELMQTLQQALELDPQRPETYRYLVGYYLSAPPIAGGSLERAEETARRLAEIDPQAGEQLLAQVQRRREASTPPPGD